MTLKRFVVKISVNSLCPCGSGKKYKKCCQIYHKGAKPKDALTLMKSRYSAYVANEAGYIIKTTHQNSPYISQTKQEIVDFCKNTEFLGLEILEFVDGESEAFVTFKAILSSGVLFEKSRFLKDDGVWYYHSGEFLS